uniref:Uncharacterized protein n=1 Tax=Romanomermis culicivorax TaxID=13658 RepID=A0A915K8L0_ROMCU
MITAKWTKLENGSQKAAHFPEKIYSPDSQISLMKLLRCVFARNPKEQRKKYQTQKKRNFSSTKSFSIKSSFNGKMGEKR